MITMLDWKPRFEAMISACANEANRRMMAEPHRLRWVYLPVGEDGRWGVLGIIRIDGELPEGWVYADAEALPCNLTRDELRCWMRERAGRLPVIGA